MVHHVDERALVEWALAFLQGQLEGVGALALLVVEFYHLIDLLAGGLDDVELLVDHCDELDLEASLVQRSQLLAGRLQRLSEFGLALDRGEAAALLQQVIAGILR